MMSKDKELFIKTLNEIIRERSKSDKKYYITDVAEAVSAEIYFKKVYPEMMSIAWLVYNSDDALEEQIGNYETLSGYINAIIDDIISEDMSSVV